MNDIGLHHGASTSPAQPVPLRRRLLRNVLAAVLLAMAAGYLWAVFQLATQQRRFLFNVRDDGRLVAAGGVPVPDSRTVSLTAADGTKLSAWYRPPARKERTVHLFLHGQGGQLAIQTRRWRGIAELGDGVLALSYRGYPGSQGEPTEEGLMLDARAAWDWLVARHPRESIVLHGHSLGSGVAVRLAAMVGVSPAALVLEAPFTAAVDVAADRFPLFPVNLLMLDQFRSRDWIGKVSSPVLIVHGTADRVIPHAHAEHLYRLARDPKELVLLREADHNTLVRDGLYEHVARFVDRNRDHWTKVTTNR